MYSVILTELGIAVFDEQKCLKAFPFENQQKILYSLKKESQDLVILENFLQILKQYMSMIVQC